VSKRLAMDAVATRNLATSVPISDCVAEFVGTFLLIFTVGCNVLSGNGTWGAVSIALVLMVSIYAFGSASGAHFNPAVSVSLALAKKLPNTEKTCGGWKQVGIYVAAQLCGGLSASLCYGSLFNTAFPLAAKTGLMHGAVFCELVYTFMLCFVVLNTAASKAKGGKNQYFGLAIAFVIIAGGYGAGAVGAGCFNPAVALSIFASSKFFMISGSSVATCLAYIGAEFAGAALAVFLFQVVRPEEKDEDDSRVGLGYSFHSKFASEVIGTYLLVFTVGLNVLGSTPAGAFSIAASLTCMIYALGDISGGHFNPAVTLAVQYCGKGKANPSELGHYFAAQILGGVLGAFSYAFVHGGQTFPLGPGTGHNWASVSVAEIVFTFVLCFVVLSVACVPDKKQPAPEFTGLIIGSCVTAGGFAIGSVSGGCLNPAVSIGVAAAHILGGGFFVKALAYAVFQLVGGAAAAGLFRVVYADEVDRQLEKESALSVKDV